MPACSGRAAEVITPFAPVLTRFDAGLTTSVESMVGLVSQQVPGPLGLGMLFMFAWQGVQVANGDHGPIRELVPLLMRFSLAFWLITDTAAYLYYVRDVTFIGVPARLISAITGLGNVPMGAAGLGSVLDSLFAQVWQASALLGQTADLTTRVGIAQAIMGFLLTLGDGVALVVCAAISFVCDFFLNLEVAIGPLLIPFWPFPALRHYAASWKGVGVAFILAQVVTFMTMQVALLGCQPIMAEMTNSLITSLTQPAAAVDALNCLFAMGALLWIAAGAIVAVPLVTFFIAKGGSAPSALVPVTVRS